MATLTPLQVYQLVTAAGPSDIRGRAMATAVVLRESGGNTNARNVNKDGSIDRGIWQWNNKAWPNISDTIAFDPKASTAMAYQISKGWTDFSPWKLAASNKTQYKNAGVILVPVADDKHGQVDIPESIWNTVKSITGYGGDPGAANSEANPSDIPVIGPAIGGISSVVDFLNKLGQTIFSVGFWKRSGLVVLGAAIIIAALSITFKDQAADVAKVAL